MVEHRRLLVWWLTGAATLLVILIAVLGYFVVSTASSFVHPTWGCLPEDFPRPAHVAILEVDQVYDQLPAGATLDCHMRVATRDSYASVYDFFYKHLAQGDWTWTFIGGGSDVTGGDTITFKRRSRPDVHGSLTIQKRLGLTPILIQLIS